MIPCISMHGVKWNSCAVQLSTVMPSPVSLHCNFERQVASKACLSSAFERPVTSKACPSSHFERQVASKACLSSAFERPVALKACGAAILSQSGSGAVNSSVFGSAPP